jgi:DNA-binding response OmpR family regulator
MKTPLATSPEKMTAAPGHPSPPVSRHRHILMVDGDRHTCQANARMLFGSGYTVDTAEDGVDAWLALADNRYDLLVTTYHLPGLSGLELITQLRFKSRFLPAILAAENLLADELNRCPWLQIEALVKTLTDGKLLATVKAVLGATGGLRELAPRPYWPHPPVEVGRRTW